MKLSFPTALRKMWSGGEVQEWINKQLNNPWQDIKSAPKGATVDNPCKEHWILGVNSHGEQKVIRWCMEYPNEKGCWMFAYAPSDYIDGIQEFHPTHWMPLFESPKKLT
jgi:hypothetical protein